MSTLSTFLGMGAMWFLWWEKKTKRIYLIISAASFGLSALSYHNARVTGPLLIVALTILNLKVVKRHLADVAIAFGCGIMVLLPLILFIVKSPDLVLRRGEI